MKILNLHTAPAGLFSPVGNPTGGLEKVVIDLHNLFREFGHDIQTICRPEDAKNLGVGSLVVCDCGADIRGNRWNAFVDHLVSIANEIKPDVILIHGTNKLLNGFNKHNIPVLFVDHQPYNSINLMYHEGFFGKSVPLNRGFGGVCVGVSEISNIDKEHAVVKQKICEYFKFDGVLRFQYITDELKSVAFQSKGNGKGITIGIPDPIKRIHAINKVRKLGVFDDYTIITQLNKIPKPKFLEYLEKNVYNKPEIKSRVLVNVSREQTLNTLAESMVYYSTCPSESSGITAFEALSLGVPVIFADNKYVSGKHASTEHLPGGEGWAWCYESKITPDFISLLTKEENRERVRKAMFELNSKERVLNELLAKFKSFAPEYIYEETLEKWFV